MDDLKPVLERVHLFRGLTSTQLERIASLMHTAHYGTGDIIFEQGTEGDTLAIISHGQVEIRVRNNGHSDTTLVILGAGQCVGEMALLDQGTRSATVIAIQAETTLHCLNGEHFRELCAEDTAIGYTMMRNIALNLSFKIRHQNLFA